MMETGASSLKDVSGAVHTSVNRLDGNSNTNNSWRRNLWVVKPRSHKQIP